MLIYLIHFDEKLHHAGHYLGSTTDIRRRLQEHAENRGARIIEVINDLDIDWRVAAVWTVSPRYTLKVAERIAKDRHNGSKYCPLCNERNIHPKHCRPFPLHGVAEVTPLTRTEILCRTK